MSPLWQSICFTALLIHCVHSDLIDSNASKSEERDHSSRSHSAYESNGYPSQSLITANGLNSPQQSMAVSESNSAPHYGGHQTNDQIDQNKKERKTLILAIPVKLSMPKAERDNYEQMSPQSSEVSQSQSLSLYSKSPFGLPLGLSGGQSSPAQPESLESDESEGSAPKSPTLPPLSQKIYSSLENQLKSLPYSTVNSHKSVNEQSMPSSLSYGSNDRKYKTSYDLKDQKSIGSQYGRDANTYRENPRQEYKSPTNEGVATDYGQKEAFSKGLGLLTDKYSYDPYDKRLKQKDAKVGKGVFESTADNKPDYEYDTEEEEEVEDKKVDDDYTSGLYKGFLNNKNVYNPRNSRKNANNAKNYGNYGSNPALIASLVEKGKAITAQSLPIYPNEPFDSWQQFYFSKPSSWPRLPDTVDTNLLSLLNGYKNPITDKVRNNIYAPAFDLLAESQLKAASNPMSNSKIYGPAVKYQSSHPMINLLNGYGLLDVNGELYPAPISPLVGQSQAIQQSQSQQIQQIQQIQANEQNGDQNSANRDSIKPHRRNPLLLRPNFMSGLGSGLRSGASKPSASKGPFGSASTTHSLLSSLPSLPSLASLPTSFSLNAKSIPRQIFPYFYG